MTTVAISQVIVPVGLSREQAASYIGIGTTLFEEMVSDGRMPSPKCINSRRVWDRIAIESAFSERPVAGENTHINPWDKV